MADILDAAQRSKPVGTAPVGFPPPEPPPHTPMGGVPLAQQNPLPGSPQNSTVASQQKQTTPAPEMTAALVDSLIHQSAPLQIQPKDNQPHVDSGLTDSTKTKGKGNWSPKIIALGITILVLLVSIPLTVYFLSNKSQNVVYNRSFAGCGCAPDGGDGSCGSGEDRVPNIDCDSDNDGQGNACCSAAPPPPPGSSDCINCAQCGTNGACNVASNGTPIAQKCVEVGNACGGPKLCWQADNSCGGPAPTQRPAGGSSPAPGSGGGSCPGNVNCDDCSGFNQGQCINQSSCCGAACDSGLSVCGGGCYPAGYKTCPGQAGCFKSDYNCGTDPCSGVNCPSGQFCSHGICAPQPSGRTGEVTVSFSCGKCSADRRCDSGPSEGGGGYGKECSQVDLCIKRSDGSIDFSTCRAVQLCAQSCSGGSPSSPSSTPQTPPPPTNTPIIGQCNNIHIYTSGGEDITQKLQSQTANVKPGDKLTLAVAGTNATEGRFRVNGAPSGYQTTSTKNEKSEYIYQFTIPANTTQFTIEAEVKVGGQWK